MLKTFTNLPILTFILAAISMALQAGDADSHQTYNQLEQVLRLLSAKPASESCCLHPRDSLWQR